MASISKYDFDFVKAGHGIYKVTFTSPKTGKQWISRVTDMELIDDTKNEEYPLIKNLNILKSFCKKNS